MEMMGQCLAGLAMVAAGLKQVERALRLAAAGAHLSALIAQPAYAIQPADVERALAPTRQALDVSRAAAASAQGQEMTLKEAIAFALG